MKSDQFRPPSSLNTIRSLLALFASVGTLRVGTLTLSTLTSIIVARHLGPADYGQVAFVLAVLSLLSIPSNNAMAPLLVRQVSAYEQQQNWPMLRGFMSWSARTMGSLALLTTVPLAGWAAWALMAETAENATLFLLGIPLVFLWAGAARVSGVLQGLKKVVLAQSFDWLLTPAFYLVLILLFWKMNSLSPLSVIGSTMVSLLLSVSVGLFVLHRFLPTELASSRSTMEQSFWISAWRYFAIIQAVGVANSRAPVILLGTLSDEVETGLFRVADNFASLLSISLLVANAVIGPYVTRLHASGRLEELGRLVRRTARITLAISLPAIVAIIFLGEWVLELLFGASYTSAYPALAILLVGQIVNIACGSVGLILNMTGHEKQALNTWMLALLLNTLLGLILVPLYGAVGAAISAAVSTVTWNILLLARTKNLLGISAAIL